MRYLMLVTMALAGCVRGRGSIAGHWLGEARLGKETARVELLIDSTSTPSGVVVELAQWGLPKDTAAAVQVDRGRVGFTVGPAAKQLSFQGTLAGDSLAGRLARGADTGSFAVVRVVDLPEAELQRVIGTYRTPDGRLAGVTRFEEYGEIPMVIDYAGGRIGPLYPISTSRFLVGRAVVAPVFPADTLELTRGSNGEVVGLRLTRPGEPLAALRVGTSDEPVTFTNGEVTLGGTLTLPPTPGSHPALVLVHGSGPESRDFLGPWARFFSGLGFAVLAYDKRGVGASTGDWKGADFYALAQDALAGVRFLAARADIRRDRIGLWGISQAGWIEPMVAAQAPKEIAFVIVHAGTGTTVADQGLLSMQHELRYTGVSEDQIHRATSYQRLSDEVLRTGRGRDQLDAAYQRDKDVPGVFPPPAADAWFPKFIKLLLDFDPAPFWQRVTCPVLLIYGELDGIVPPRESAPPIARALQKAGNHDVTIKVLPGGNHVLFAAKTGARAEYSRAERFVPGYFDLMRDWLQTRVELPH